ncbi:unnamed protein product [Candidula unifasciata]|uniref:Fibrinogen C-terminal domain-containing protein n=1 Tax=Candidula unifasciata TaxID=100452 RepID=A0A8S3ZC17_9EUPU|nr:unnamed protein product [Candidula unifasciata]
MPLQLPPHYYNYYYHHHHHHPSCAISAAVTTTPPIRSPRYVYFQCARVAIYHILKPLFLFQHHESSCYQGMPHISPREKFVLQGKLQGLCDTETDGGGWVIIQRRVRGDVDFYRGWDYYKRGFGTPDTDFWIGNDIIHNLTSQGYNELRIDFTYKGTQYFAQYANFNLGDESSQYLMTVATIMATNSLLLTGTMTRMTDNCAVAFHGAWWYNGCYNANLNGAWSVTDGPGIAWYFAAGANRIDLSFTEMKIRNI